MDVDRDRGCIPEVGDLIQGGWRCNWADHATNLIPEWLQTRAYLIAIERCGDPAKASLWGGATFQQPTSLSRQVSAVKLSKSQPTSLMAQPFVNQAARSAAGGQRSARSDVALTSRPGHVEGHRPRHAARLDAALRGAEAAVEGPVRRLRVGRR